MSEDVGGRSRDSGPLSPADAQNSWKAIPLTSPGGGLDHAQSPVAQWQFFLPTSAPLKNLVKEVA